MNYIVQILQGFFWKVVMQLKKKEKKEKRVKKK